MSEAFAEPPVVAEPVYAPEFDGVADESARFEEASIARGLSAGDSVTYRPGTYSAGTYEAAVAEANSAGYADPRPDSPDVYYGGSYDSSSAEPTAAYPGHEDLEYANEARALIEAHEAAEEAAAYRAAQEAARVQALHAQQMNAQRVAQAREAQRPEARRGEVQPPAVRDAARLRADFGSIYGEIFGPDQAEEALQEDAPHAEAILQAGVEALRHAPIIEAPAGFSLGGHRPGGTGAARGAYRELSDYDASGFASMEEFQDEQDAGAEPIAFRGLRWIRRNVGNLKVTVSLQRSASPPRQKRPDEE